MQVLIVHETTFMHNFMQFLQFHTCFMDKKTSSENALVLKVFVSYGGKCRNSSPVAAKED